MLNNQSVIHHFVARFLLRKFFDNNGYIWLGYKCIRQVIKRQFTLDFAIDYLNSTYDLSQLAVTDGESFHDRIETLRPLRSDKYEIVLQKIDTKAALPIAEIIEMARRNHRPQLTPERKNRVIEFLLAQERRSPESQQQIFATIGTDSVVNDVLEAALREGGFDIPREQFNQSPFFLEFKQVLGENRAANFAAADHPILQQRIASPDYS